MATAEKLKTARLGLRLSEEHKERIERAAAMTGQTVNSYAASELVKRSDEILEKEEVRRLSDRDRDIFLALLEADGEPNEALKAAAAEYKKGRRVGTEYHFEL
jgi:uncharacterized protein (DUF1778 family)